MVAALGNSKDYTLKQYLVFADKLQNKARVCFIFSFLLWFMFICFRRENVPTYWSSWDFNDLQFGCVIYACEFEIEFGSQVWNPQNSSTLVATFIYLFCNLRSQNSKSNPISWIKYCPTVSFIFVLFIIQLFML